MRHVHRSCILVIAHSVYGELHTRSVDIHRDSIDVDIRKESTTVSESVRPILVPKHPLEGDDSDVISTWKETAIRMDRELVDIDDDHGWVPNILSAEQDTRDRTYLLLGVAVAVSESVVSIPATRLLKRTTNGEYIIKYFNSCGSADPDGLDEISREYLVLKMLDGLGIAPKVYELSNTLDVSEDMSWKTSPHLQSLYVRSGKACEFGRASVRASVIDKVGFSVDAYFFNKLKGVEEALFQSSMRTRQQVKALLVGIRVIELLQELHDQGFLHNGINGKTVVFMDPQSKALWLKDEHGKKYPDILLVGLGESAKYFPPRIGTNTVGRLGRRDDLIQTIELIAKIMKQFSEEDSIWGKAKAFIVGRAPVYTPESLCAIHYIKFKLTCPAGIQRLDEALTDLKSLRSPDHRPDYSRTISTLRQAINEVGR